MEDIIYMLEDLDNIAIIALIIQAIIIAYWIILIHRLGIIAKEARKINNLEKKMDTLIGLSANQLKELRSVSGALDNTEPYVIEKKDD